MPFAAARHPWQHPAPRTGWSCGAAPGLGPSVGGTIYLGRTSPPGLLEELPMSVVALMVAEFAPSQGKVDALNARPVRPGWTGRSTLSGVPVVVRSDGRPRRFPSYPAGAEVGSTCSTPRVGRRRLTGSPWFADASTMSEDQLEEGYL